MLFGCSSVVGIRLFFSCRAAVRQWEGRRTARRVQASAVDRRTPQLVRPPPRRTRGGERGRSVRPGRGSRRRGRRDGSGARRRCRVPACDPSRLLLLRQSRVPEPGAEKVVRACRTPPPTSARKVRTPNDVGAPRAAAGHSEAAPVGGSAPLRKGRRSGRWEGDRPAAVGFGCAVLVVDEGVSVRGCGRGAEVGSIRRAEARPGRARSTFPVTRSGSPAGPSVFPRCPAIAVTE